MIHAICTRPVDAWGLSLGRDWLARKKLLGAANQMIRAADEAFDAVRLVFYVRQRQSTVLKRRFEAHRGDRGEQKTKIEKGTFDVLPNNFSRPVRLCRLR